MRKILEKLMKKYWKNAENTGKVSEKILEKCKKYWKSQGNSSVQKSGNHGHQRPLSSETTSHEKPQFGCTDSFSYIFDLTSETTLSYETKGHFFMATSACSTCQ